MLLKPRDLLGGPVYFMIAIAIGLFGYALGFFGGVGVSIAAKEIFDFENLIFSAALGGLCSAIWPALLRRHQNRVMPLLALLIAAIAATIAAIVFDVPSITGNRVYDSILLGTLTGGATSMIVLLRVPFKPVKSNSVSSAQ
ncbi:MAG TPA: hypothetical protein ENL03_06780 [Phycisphaerae bacterium]|nr:hypothetical protein [Phycisphaerae bacterium]